MKRLLKQNRGMTLMEILVALSLLMIIIVGTTPVMLQAYNGLYTAGEYTQKTYNAKTEIEDQLATRSSIRVYRNFAVNYKNLGLVAQVNAKRAVSSLTGSLETLFTGGRAYVTIVSGDRVNDDSNTYEITVKISNYQIDNFNQINESGKFDSAQIRLAFKATLPNKKNDANQTTEKAVYGGSGGVATIDVVEEKSNLATGLVTISLTSDDFSFTKSPVQIKIYYYDENGEILEAVDYLHIKTPTIIAAGKTNNYDYYTTAGVQEDGTFEITGRKMDISNATGTRDYLGEDGKTFNYGQVGVDFKGDGSGEVARPTITLPETTIIRSVKWISEDQTNTSYESNYFVLAGTNGVIYRTYSFTGSDTVTGKVNLGFSSDKEVADYNANKNGVNQLKDDKGKPIYVIGVTDKNFVIDKGTTTVYPAVWGGDFSHIFAWAAWKGGRTYADGSWLTQKSTGVGQDGYYSNRVNYSYYYNGFDTEYSYYSQNSRTISYILTEKGTPLRIGGYLMDPNNYTDSINLIWENPEPYVNVESLSADFHKDSYTIKILGKEVGFPGYDTWYKNYAGLKRCVISEESPSDQIVTKNANRLPVYFADNTILNTEADKRPEHGLAQIRLKGLTTFSPEWLGYLDGDGKDTPKSSVQFGYNSWVNQSRVTITDSVYIPGSGVLYLGNVAAYGSIYQTDNIATGNNDASRIENNDTDNTGSITHYYILSNDTTTKTSVYKFTTSDKNSGTLRSVLNKTTPVSGDGCSANDADSNSFFVTRNNKQETTPALFNDVLFTMGFSSNREMVYNGMSFDVTSSNSYTEHYKSYEQWYFLSEYGNKNHFPNAFLHDNIDGSGSETGLYLNKSTNDYYNVWFPSEMYNLTKVATKDGVAVAVGYTVAGSSYQFVNWTTASTTDNTSTALGGIFNDGVMSAMVIGDSSFRNLLYYKANDTVTEPNNMNKDYLTTNATTSAAYKTHYSEYGTHARNSVQFTGVDISVENNSGNLSYYAYYVDNRGRVFRSLVATKASDANKPTLVSYVASLSNAKADEAPSKMVEMWPGTNNNPIEKITSIKCYDDYIIVVGHPKSEATAFNIVVGKIGTAGATPTWKTVTIDGLTKAHKANEMVLLNGYLYIVGENGSQGWISATPMSEIERAFDSTTATTAQGTLKQTTSDPLFAIDGHN